MRTRTSIAILISVMVNAVVFGAGAIAVMSIPALRDTAYVWLPAVVVASFIISPILCWYLAPRLRSRWVRRHPDHETI